MNKKSMSVTEMRKLLGIGKTDSYWLVKKNYFETVIIAGKMRVMVESFENWYDNQLHYKKVNGDPCGKNWTAITMSVQETARLLGILKFPPALSSTHTALVLKEPKTKTSVRKIFLPKTVAEMLVKRYEEVENLKELFGDEYTDYNLVFASSCGRPIEGQVINRALKKLIDDNDLPPVVFHSFRHSSITYKLKLNGGDKSLHDKKKCRCYNDV